MIATIATYSKIVRIVTIGRIGEIDTIGGVVKIGGNGNYRTLAWIKNPELRQ